MLLAISLQFVDGLMLVSDFSNFYVVLDAQCVGSSLTIIEAGTCLNVIRRRMEVLEMQPCTVCTLRSLQQHP